MRHSHRVRVHASLDYTRGDASSSGTREELKAFVRKYVQLDAETPQLIWPIPARSIGCIEFTFRAPYCIRHLDRSRLETTYPATLVGAKTHQRIQLESQGRTETFAILFQPIGLHTLFALPGNLLVDEHYDARAVLGSRLSQLREMLGEADSFEERVQIANGFFGPYRLPS
jgi:hypothetical protein